MFLTAILSAALALAGPAAPSSQEQGVSLGRATAPLTGPWKFHPGDDPAWAEPDFDDSQWEQVDLTAPAGAHDADVGLSGYVNGWGGRGHKGMSGYGWYRLHLQIAHPAGEGLAIAGPPAVDSAYQIYCNHQLLGGIGDFRPNSPRVFSIQPRFFSVPNGALRNATIVVAIRVWMARWDLVDPDAGGLRIAPTLGTSDAVRGVYQTQWIETLRGYIVEVVEALGLVSLCLGIFVLARIEGDHRGKRVGRHGRYAPLYAACLLTAAYRLNQALFFWGQFETVPVFEVVSQFLLYPAALAAWTMAWARLLPFENARWWKATAGVSVLYLATALVEHGIFHGCPPRHLTSLLDMLITACRLFFLASTMFFLYRLVFSQRRSRGWLAAMIVAVSVAQFAPELSRIGMPGIWFPFGTGVSRAQFAYAFLFAIAAVFFFRRLIEVTEAKSSAPG